jgi:hypothetical protein
VTAMQHEGCGLSAAMMLIWLAIVSAMVMR